MTKLKAAGLSDSSVGTISNRLKHLAEYSDLDDLESVKCFIASKPVADSYKHELAKAYNYYILYQGLEWARPKYRFERKVPKIPTDEQQINTRVTFTISQKRVELYIGFRR